jgi:transcriptional regulator with XRE-family HTH domain
MKKQDVAKLREKLEGELKQYRKLSRTHQRGRMWMREMRQALGMSVTELAYRLGCTRKLVYRIEECERKGRDRLEIMQEVAEAMYCTLVYAIVPWDGQTLAETAERVKTCPRWRTEKQEARDKKKIEEFEAKMDRQHHQWVQQQRDERSRRQRLMEEATAIAHQWAAAMNKQGQKERQSEQGKEGTEGQSALPSDAGGPGPGPGLIMDRVANVKENVVRFTVMGRTEHYILRAKDAAAAVDAAERLEKSRGKKLEEIPGLILRDKRRI